MVDALVLDAARAAHIIGLALGLGLAIFADVMAARSVLNPIATKDVALLQVIHRAILAGLAVLWISGLFLLHARTGFDPTNFTPKLMLKLLVVVLLTANALVIGRYALPTYKAHCGQRFGDIALTLRLRLACVAALSLSCWFSALALGVFSQLKPMDAGSLQAVFAPLFLAGLVGAIAVTFLAGLASLTARQPEPAWPRDVAMNRVTTRALHP
ncbi:MAG: hypothetical protein AB3N11_04885 [Arenibacterium sp.]